MKILGITFLIAISFIFLFFVYQEPEPEVAMPLGITNEDFGGDNMLLTRSGQQLTNLPPFPEWHSELGARITTDGRPVLWGKLVNADVWAAVFILIDGEWESTE